MVTPEAFKRICQDKINRSVATITEKMNEALKRGSSTLCLHYSDCILPEEDSETRRLLDEVLAKNGWRANYYHKDYGQYMYIILRELE